MMDGTFVWNELLTGDVERAKAFLAATLGWTFEEFPLPEGPYWVAKVGDTLVGGVCHFDTGSLPTDAPMWLPFVQVDDIDRRVKTALQTGAMVVQPPHDVPNVGRVAVLRDPTGAALGWLSEPSEGSRA